VFVVRHPLSSVKRCFDCVTGPSAINPEAPAAESRRRLVPSGLRWVVVFQDHRWTQPSWCAGKTSTAGPRHCTSDDNGPLTQVRKLAGIKWMAQTDRASNCRKIMLGAGREIC
jgi:hypothetical protein